jgi:hypothetical protein
MPNSKVGLRSIAALAGVIVVAMPLSAQARCLNEMSECRQPGGAAQVSTVFRYHTVQKVSDVNRYHNVTRTSYRDITRTKFHDVHRIRYADVTRTHYVRHINRIVNVTRVQPVIRVHTVTLVHNRIVDRVHTHVVPRVHVAVVPRVHYRTVVLHHNQYASETKWMPTRTVMAGQRTMTAEMGKAQFASYNGHGNLKLMNMAKPRKQPTW